MFISLVRRSASRLAQAGRLVGYGLPLVVVAVLLAASARAQEASAGPTAENYRQVIRTCKADYAKFCDATSATTASGRDQAICLKYQKQDLSLPCRTAVNAVSR